MNQRNDSLEGLINSQSLFHFQDKLPTPLDSARTVFTLYGRNALFLGLQSLHKLTAKRKILVPALSCGAETSAILAAGFDVAFYGVKSPDLQCSVSDIEEKVTGDTAGVLVTHYFGFPQLCSPMLREFCTSHGLFMIEDCAHALGSSLNGQPLGSAGDFSIFSLRKSLPLPHGGALVVNNRDLQLPTVQPPSPNAIDFDLLVYFAQRAGFVAAGTPIEAIYQSLGKEIDHFGARLPEYGGYELGLSVIARLLITAMDIESHFRSRQTAFRRYGQYFSRHIVESIQPLYSDCGREINPPFFPVVVRLDSEQCYSLLSAAGFRCPIPFWSRNHSTQPREYPEILNLKNRLMILSLTDPLKNEDLARVLENLENNV